MNRLVHFEIHATNPERAMKFYADVFGWNFSQWGTEQYWMAMTAAKESTEPGINGGLLLRKGEAPKEGQAVNAYVCTMQVENFDETAEKIASAGGIVALPKFAFPGMAWQGYFKDTEGNLFGVHQTDKNAK
jgi:predicted enzyme related to lactoylglutathione lyase